MLHSWLVVEVSWQTLESLQKTNIDHLSSNLTFNTAHQISGAASPAQPMFGSPRVGIEWTAPFLDGKSSQHEDLRFEIGFQESVVYTLIYFIYIYIHYIYRTFIYMWISVYIWHICHYKDAHWYWPILTWWHGYRHCGDWDALSSNSPTVPCWIDTLLSVCIVRKYKILHGINTSPNKDADVYVSCPVTTKRWIQ